MEIQDKEPVKTTVKGSDAGTSLKTMLLNLSPSTKEATAQMKELGLLTEKGTSQFYDANGSIKSLADISELLKTKLAKLSDEQRQMALKTMFGTDAIRAANILYKEGANGITTMADAMTKIKSADVAATKLDNVKGRIELLKGSVETAAISFGNNLLPMIDKVVAKVQDMTNGFNKLSPEMQQNIANAALVAAGLTGVTAALGITLAVAGTAISGFGALTAVLAGSGGLVAALTGPVGLVIGAGLAAAAIAGLSKQTDESKEVNLEHAKSLIDQQKSLEDLTGKYEALREKNQLSNAELLLFKDLQDDLKTATSAEEIANLTKQADYLREKSGLTNDEFLEMLSLNDKLIEKVPEAGRAFSEQGNAILENTDDLHRANQALRDNIALELEVQKTKADAQLNDHIQAQIEATEALNGKIRELNSAKIEAAGIEFNIRELSKLKQDQLAAGEDVLAQKTQSRIDQLGVELAGQNSIVSGIAGEVQEKQKSLDKSNEQIVKTQELFNELINVQLANAGINATGAEGIAQLDQAIAKTQSRITELNRIKQEQGGLNQQQQEELDNLGHALGLYRDTKGEIQNIQGEQGSVNQKIEEGTQKSRDMSRILSASEVKDIQFSGDGYHEAKIITDEASLDVRKEIDVTDYGKANAIHKDAEKDANKSVWVTVKKAASSFGNWLGDIGIPGFFVGSRDTPAGLAALAERGRELTYFPGMPGLALVNQPSIMNLPKGAKVIPNADTEAVLQGSHQSQAILRKWNIPAFGSGSTYVPGGLALVGESGRELMYTGGNSAAAAKPAGRGDVNQTFHFHGAVDPNEASNAMIREWRRMEVLYGG
ncbi:phage tail tape measure protein [Bacillus sp. T33-2]|uniref:phage tail tape measure protein n=1 Tax=Bacillus sp. T33-2 TaxID=2054168 RepID=UPI000C772B3A|nr:phage tail tape measure protein [Bacillus sp. T33-2]PLR93189.1 phage tail tape measure protein [Bacillus sp. T33-2]